jgi:hypothetical protein
LEDASLQTAQVTSTVLPGLMDLARAGTAIFAGLYAAGLMIVNLELGNYGLSTLSLARAQYVLVGTLWSIFMVATLAAYELVHSQISKVPLNWRYSQSIRRLYGGVLTVFCCAVLVAFMDIVSGSRGDVLHLTGALPVIGLNALVLSLALRLVGGSYGIGLSELFQQWGWARFGLRTIAGVFMIFWGLITYAAFVFPIFPAGVGGGGRISVMLVFETSPEIDWAGLKIPQHGKTVGPVKVLLDADDTLTICCGSADVSRDAQPIQINKKFLAAVIIQPGNGNDY